MTEIVTYNSVSITNLVNNIQLYKNNPSNIQRAILEHLDEVTGGKVNIVDPTNPFVFLLESSTINTSVAIQENTINLRKQYSNLSQNEDDLYMHLSDNDFINRFAVPSSTDFIVAIPVSSINRDIMQSMNDSPNPVQCTYKTTIARDSEFYVDGLYFTLQYPIDIYLFANGTFQISYNDSKISSLQVLANNIIDYNVRRDTVGKDWVFFTIPLSQFVITTSYFTLQRSMLFTQDVIFNDQFYYCRVFYKNTASGNKWLEFITTHTDQVYDPFVPTAILKVTNNNLNVTIPLIYVTNGIVTGDVRVDVYTTKGQITIDLSNYKPEAYGYTLKAIDEINDIDSYTNAMNNMNIYAYSNNLVSGGTNGLTFEELRSRVINNSIGDRQIPITNAQLNAYVNNYGFDLVKNVDVITNRIFLAVQRLPKPSNVKLLTAANMGMSTIVTDLASLNNLSNVIVNNNTNRITILSKNLFNRNNGITNIVSDNDINILNHLNNTDKINNINLNQYFCNPFYYVLDNSQNEFDTRIYHLDQPVASQLSFISQNETLQAPVNTSTYTLTKQSNRSGYVLTLTTKSGQYIQGINPNDPNNSVIVQLGFYPKNGTGLAYINGTISNINSSTPSEKIITFNIDTNHDLDIDDYICITNARSVGISTGDIWCKLSDTFHILYTINSTQRNSNYVKGADDTLLGYFMLPNNSMLVTHETMNLVLGYKLSNLWSRTRTMANSEVYAKYTENIEKHYDSDVYQNDIITGLKYTINNGVLTYNKIHSAGDQVFETQTVGGIESYVLDSNGHQIPVYSHLKGDIILDANGGQILANSKKEIDIFFVDGRYFYATDISFINYLQEINTILTTWITQNLIDIQNNLLEQTKIYFYPKTTLGSVNVYYDSTNIDSITSEQSFVVDLYVLDKVYQDINIRQTLSNNIISIIDTYTDNSTINMSTLHTLLLNYCGTSVESLRISGLGGDKNYQILNLVNPENRLCVKKKLTIQPDGNIIITEDITINFINIEQVLISN